jgi:hypothetical protein
VKSRSYHQRYPNGKNEWTATTKAKEGRVEKVGRREVEERRSQREQQIQEGKIMMGWGCIFITIHGITRCHPMGRQTN